MSCAGTLTPIVKDPDRAFMSEQVQQTPHELKLLRTVVKPNAHILLGSCAAFVRNKHNTPLHTLLHTYMQRHTAYTIWSVHGRCMASSTNDHCPTSCIVIAT